MSSKKLSKKKRSKKEHSSKKQSVQKTSSRQKSTDRQAQYWLMKTEPDVFSIDDLEDAGREPWDGIRNYQARNFMRDDMKIGDGVLIYHSNAKPPGIVGLARVASEPYPDPSQFEEGSKYHDPKSDSENPRWILIDIEFVETFETPFELQELKSDAALSDMLVVQRGQRLSIQPVEARHFRHVLDYCEAKSAPTEFTP